LYIAVNEPMYLVMVLRVVDMLGWLNNLESAPRRCGDHLPLEGCKRKTYGLFKRYPESKEFRKRG
jgi:hypothetical protein